jgi:DNA-directed RNA polymerase subunit RPC12/RpoP
MLEWEDFKTVADRFTVDNSEWKEMNVKCPECGQPIYKNMTIVLTSCPPQYQYKCFACGWTGTAYH